MKRELFENVKVVPGGNGAVIDRGGFLSAIFGVSVSAKDTIKVKVEHADTDTGTFEELEDSFAGVNGALKDVEIAEGDTANIYIDLVGCKRYVRFSAEGSASGQEVTVAVVLGDPGTAPV